MTSSREIRHKLPEPLPSKLGTDKVKEFENFQLKLLLSLDDDTRFAKYLEATSTWNTSAVANRGYTAVMDGTTVQVTAEKQARTLELFLRTIASVIPPLSNFIIHQSTSMGSIWSRVRTYYGIRKTGGRCLDWPTINFEANESYECFWERVYSFAEDCLLSPSDDITHCGTKPTVKETFSSSMQNMLVSYWLSNIDSRLPKLVQLHFATQLRSATPMSFREEISEAIPALLQSSVEADLTSAKIQTGNPAIKLCSLCHAAGKFPNNHFLTKCTHLLDHDRKYLQSKTTKFRTRAVDVVEELSEQIDSSAVFTDSKPVPYTAPIVVRKIDIEGSPGFIVQYGKLSAYIYLDYGTTGDLISISEVKRLNLDMHPTQQKAVMADGGTPLQVLGEVYCQFQYSHHKLVFNALVVKEVKGDILGGVPFHKVNDIFARIAKRTIFIGDCCKLQYNPGLPPSLPTSRAVTVARNPSLTTILPGESISMDLPEDFHDEPCVLIEPRLQSPSFNSSKDSDPWLRPTITDVVNDTIELVNTSAVPVTLRRHEQVCNIRRTIVVSESNMYSESNLDCSSSISSDQSAPEIILPHSNCIEINSNLSPELRSKLESLHRTHDEVFSPEIGCYNGASGPFEAHINMGDTKPPQRKGRCPLYCPDTFQILQAKHDDLDKADVTARPSELGISLEYLSPSFLVRKPAGDPKTTAGWRLVTSFGSIAEYSKPQPALMPNVEE